MLSIVEKNVLKYWSQAVGISQIIQTCFEVKLVLDDHVEADEDDDTEVQRNARQRLLQGNAMVKSCSHFVGPKLYRIMHFVNRPLCAFR